MKIIHDTKEFHIKEPTAVAIGKFDGIHLGHAELLKHIINAKERGLLSCVFTFDPSAAIFFGGSDVKEITTLKERRLVFENMGIDILVEFPLDNDTASIEPVDFLKSVLKDKLNAKFIAAGSDLSFGHKGRGDALLLSDMANELDYAVKIIPKILYEDREISSTYLREEIAGGNMDKVIKLLGHPYSFIGTVKTGFQVGRKLGFPTMNLYPEESKLLPPMGVYYSNVIYEGADYPGLTNIGVRPTVSEDNHVSVETYLYDFDMDMYGKDITVEILSFKRGEVKFSSIYELKEQLKRDLEDGRKFHDI